MPNNNFQSGFFCGMVLIYNYVNISQYPKNPDCTFPIDLFQICLGIDLQILSFSSIFLSLNLCKKFWVRLSTIGFIAMPIIFLVFLVMYIYTLGWESRCITDSTRFTLALLFLLVCNVISLCFTWLIAKLLIILWKKKKLKRKLDNIYTIVYNPRFDIKKFVEENKEIIESIIFTEEEKAILKDKFCVVYEGVKNDREEVPSCIICMGEYEKGDLICVHPACKHLFHYDCVIGWIAEKRACPFCKIGTRTSMLLNLRKNDQKKLSNRDDNLLVRSGIAEEQIEKNEEIEIV